MQEPFETSFGVETDKDVVLVEVRTQEGAVGFGECVASTAPLYSEETTGTAWHMIREFFAPRLFGLKFEQVQDLSQVRSALAPFRGNRMAKAAVEMAVWDAFANLTQKSLPTLLGGGKQEIPVGISVGIQPDTPALLRKVEGYLAQGFQRIKVKVKPGRDLEPLRELRKAFGDIPLMADANSAYRLANIEHLRAFDEFGLMMIEQPLGHDDIVDHGELQRQLSTPICLDESIHTAADAQKAIRLGACRIINLKLGRVGGFAEALEIHQIALDHHLPLWCGGMLETGIGRLHNIAVTSLPGFVLPGDTAPSFRYFAEDVIDPPVDFVRPGFLDVPFMAGTASRVRRDRLQKWVQSSEEVRP